MQNDNINEITVSNQEEEPVCKLKNMVLSDIKAILEMFQPYKKHLTDTEQESFLRLELCAAICEAN